MVPLLMSCATLPAREQVGHDFALGRSADLAQVYLNAIGLVTRPGRVRGSGGHIWISRPEAMSNRLPLHPFAQQKIEKGLRRLALLVRTPRRIQNVIRALVPDVVFRIDNMNGAPPAFRILQV